MSRHPNVSRPSLINWSPQFSHDHHVPCTIPHRVKAFRSLSLSLFFFVLKTKLVNLSFLFSSFLSPSLHPTTQTNETLSQQKTIRTKMLSPTHLFPIFVIIAMIQMIAFAAPAPPGQNNKRGEITNYYGDQAENDDYDTAMGKVRQRDIFHSGYDFSNIRMKVRSSNITIEPQHQRTGTPRLRGRSNTCSLILIKQILTGC